MVILETPVFTRRVTKLLSVEEYRLLQLQLVARPDAGAVIPASGGIRKLRWRTSEQGKRSGLRLIYYWVVKDDKILMLMLYAKNERADLSPEQLKALKRAVEEEFK